MAVRGARAWRESTCNGECGECGGKEKVLARQDLFIEDDKAKVIQRDVERLLEVMKGQDSFSERLLTIYKSTFVPR